LQSVEGHPVMRLRGQLVPVVKMSDVLAIAAPTLSEEEQDQNVLEDPDHFSAVLLSAGTGAGPGQEASERFICFEVDALVDEREVVVKGLGSFLDKVPNIAGVTVLGADGLALILDVFGLVQSARLGSSGAVSFTPKYSSPASDVPALVARRVSRILVVDDSLATRELERSILETAGFKVDTARDGQEALKMCREKKPDLVLSDVEMPNMDGFRLTASLRQDERLNNLPVIIVSSRDSEEDRRKGMDAGAQAYIVKGQFEQNKLLETISRLIV
jgi:CheY-like chemotaxis protein